MKIQRTELIPPGGEKKVLLHSCCAPCSSEVMEAMLASGINYAIFFYNPNIHPEREYLLRKDENIRFAEKTAFHSLMPIMTKTIGSPVQRGWNGSRNAVSAVLCALIGPLFMHMRTVFRS
ncbi:hypothetical protein J2782_003294 [Brucella pseudogrignonensis]|uniref:Epoxyqueuosine reductase QueH n=1 Tax=Brucella pseudogrignonensis TaxID=419475 RepID=A0ABU1MC95_9HYPH|nr:hypothetical protein [Brucella pseudogrignonensis]